MSIIGFFIAVVIIVVVVGAIEQLLPLAAPWKNIIRIIALLVILLLLLELLGVVYPGFWRRP